MAMKKIKVYSEVVYLVAIIMLSFSVAMITSTNFGVSMIVAPAYILSQKLSFLTFGQSEYIIQGILFIVFCCLMKKVKIVYFSSFLTGIIYGAVLDLWRLIIPHFNPNITVPGSMAFPLRIIYFVIGALLTSLSVALFFKTYLYPQVYDFFVKGISNKFSVSRTKFKTGFDASCLIIASIMTFLFFGKFVGVGIGTIIMTCFNGLIIGIFGKLLDKIFVFEPIYKEFSKKFELK